MCRSRIAKIAYNAGVQRLKSRHHEKNSACTGPDPTGLSWALDLSTSAFSDSRKGAGTPPTARLGGSCGDYGYSSLCGGKGLVGFVS